MLSAIFLIAALFAQAAAETPAGPAPAAAASVSSVVVQGQKSGVARDNEVVCHKEKVLGTLFPKEVCARRADLAERRQMDQEQTRAATSLRPYSATSH
jgi:hypothetical protein